jgi:hypothetical protein
MERATKIRLAAKVLLARYGKDAPRIARFRALKSARDRDNVSAGTWNAIARSARSMVSRSAIEDRATLSDVMNGVVTGQMMAADQVSREDVERLIAEAKRRRQDMAGSES